MAVLDKSLIKIIGEKEYYRILAIMELEEAQEKETELKQVEALEMINEMLSEHDQPPLKLSWIKKWWNKFE
ncbi:hypothetical protein [Bacillus toyonensis]|uniref:hypothetical protein n=1 Tax=Bacillus toyonensis TaxID=155322 RepID=UPI002E244AF4|nr:hypothetical protein [Bacillus toyonensis]MED2738299.1 hypothetical protein [Bacillus toyonensis]